jgi:hypothetical protein
MSNVRVALFSLLLGAAVLAPETVRADEPAPTTDEPKAQPPAAAPDLQPAKTDNGGCLTCTENKCVCPNGVIFEHDKEGQWWRTRQVLDPDVRATAIGGFAMFTFGYVLAIANAITARDNDDRFIPLIPIAGPLAAVWHNGDRMSPFASGALIVSAWSQASGAVLMILAASVPRYKWVRERVLVGGGPGQAGMSVAFKF